MGGRIRGDTWDLKTTSSFFRELCGLEGKSDLLVTQLKKKGSPRPNPKDKGGQGKSLAVSEVGEG